MCEREAMEATKHQTYIFDSRTRGTVESNCSLPSSIFSLRIGRNKHRRYAVPTTHCVAVGKTER